MLPVLRRPLYRVEVDGTDYTSRFQPLVKSIDVNDRAGTATDSASITLADVGGAIKLPDEGALMRISLGDTVDGVGLTFSGFVSDVNSRGSKRGGRELIIGAKGIDPKSDAKAAQGQHLDDATFGDAAKKFAQSAGIPEVIIASELASLQRPYWAMQFESFLHWGQRISREMGATFKMQDGKAIFTPANAGMTAGGVALPPVLATLGVNLLNWSISPVFSRPRHGKVRARFFNEKKSKWEEREADVEGGGGAAFIDRFVSGTAENAERRARSLKGRSERNGGDGSVLIVGTATAKPEAPLILSGTRPGIDGTYLIDGVQHRLAKGGYTTSCDLKKPSGEAGKDGRSPTSTRSGPAYASATPTSTGRAAGPV